MCRGGRGRETRSMGRDTSRHCSLEQAVGRTVACPAGDCAFWEPGGAVLPGRCAFEHLDLSGRSGVAAELLRIRGLLERSASEDAEEVRHLYHRLLNESVDS